MHFGITIHTSSEADARKDFATQLEERIELLKLARDAGFTSVGGGQHWLSPPPPWGQAAPLILLSHAAAVAPGMELMTDILIMPLYHPAALAEECAALDALSKGNFTLGAGLGYRDHEFKQFDIEKRHRAARMEESLQILKLLFAGETVTFHGKHFQLEEARLYNMPKRPGGPPILLGAGADVGTRRAVRLADGLLLGAYVTLPSLERQRTFYEACLKEAGKRPEQGRFVIRREVFLDKSRKAALERGLGGFVQRVSGFKKMGLEDSHMPSYLTSAEETEKHLPYLMGSPEELAEQIDQYQERLGLKQMLLTFNGSQITHHQTMLAVEEFGKKVLPQFKE